MSAILGSQCIKKLALCISGGHPKPQDLLDPFGRQTHHKAPAIDLVPDHGNQLQVFQPPLRATYPRSVHRGQDTQVMR